MLKLHYLEHHDVAEKGSTGDMNEAAAMRACSYRNVCICASAADVVIANAANAHNSSACQAY
jgi:hypothetical protein